MNQHPALAGITLADLGKAYQSATVKVELKRKGWSYRQAARELGITYQHLSYVLNGHRDSRRVTVPVLALPERKHRRAA